VGFTIYGKFICYGKFKVASNTDKSEERERERHCFDTCSLSIVRMNQHPSDKGALYLLSKKEI